MTKFLTSSQNTLFLNKKFPSKLEEIYLIIDCYTIISLQETSWFNIYLKIFEEK